MEWSKLKNIIIVILLLANLFLLLMVATQERGTARGQEEALTNTISVLERGGIRVDRAHIPEEMELAPLSVERDRESERQLAAALLGECRETDLGSGRYAYESALGSAEFRSNGSFSFALEKHALPAAESGGEEEHALACMSQVGIHAALVSREENGTQVTLTLGQTWQELPVYSCLISLEYEGGSLRSLVGQRLMGTPQAAGESGELLSVPTALLRILNGINGLGDICSTITAMEPGYVLATSAEGTQLIPVWHVATDTGAYILNALSGVLERAS